MQLTPFFLPSRVGPSSSTKVLLTFELLDATTIDVNDLPYFNPI
jgi:hypothetical protein